MPKTEPAGHAMPDAHGWHTAEVCAAAPVLCEAVPAGHGTGG